MFSDHVGIELPTNDKKITGKPSNTWKLDYTLLNYPGIKEETKRNIRKYFELNGKENTIYKFVACELSGTNEEICSTKHPDYGMCVLIATRLL